MNRIYCLGEAMSDTFLGLEDAQISENEGKKTICLPYGEKLNVSLMSHKSGGSAFNVSIGLKRLGLDSYLMVTLGNDSEGKRLKSAMNKEGINSFDAVESPEFETKAAFIINGKDGDRTILVYHGKGVLDKEMIDWDKIEDNSWFYLGPMPDTVLRSAGSSERMAAIMSSTLECAITPRALLGPTPEMEIKFLNSSSSGKFKKPYNSSASSLTW